MRSGGLALAALLGLASAPDFARAECVQQMSRIPVAAAGGAPAYRANMMRRGFPAAAPAAAPKAAAARPRAMMLRTQPTDAAKPVVRKAKVVRKAGAHRVARKRPAGVRVARAAAPVVAAAPALIPTPMPVAEREMATPRAYALIATTVCQTGPTGAAAAPDIGVPVLDIAPAPGGGFPGDDTETVFPPGGPELPPGVGGPGVEIPGVPPVGPPVIGPPVIEPPFPPPPPPVIPVPEPGTWALLILGFGLIGARLRATSSARSGSPGPVGRRG